jgi:hypothetical protein
MEYIKLNEVDFSQYVSALKITKAANYTAQTNAAGNTVIDFINTKRSINVSFITLNSEVMQELQSIINNITVAVTFRNPATNTIDTINCFIVGNEADYYTIQENEILYKPFNLTFTEL